MNTLTRKRQRLAEALSRGDYDTVDAIADAIARQQREARAYRRIATLTDAGYFGNLSPQAQALYRRIRAESAQSDAIMASADPSEYRD